MPKKDYDLAHLAGMVVAERRRFAEIHDPLSVHHGGQKLMMLPYLYPAPPQGSPPFLLALQCANEAGWIDELIAELLIGGAMKALPEPVRQRFEPQAVARADLGFQDVGLQNAGGAKARRRVCMVTVAGQGKSVHGSGFLVGPQMILTSWHVIACLLDETDPGKAAADSHKKLSVQFDHCTGATACTVAVAKNWLVDSSPSHESERFQAMDYDIDQIPAGFAGFLDYAVIRLADAVGRERGYYRLDKLAKPVVPEPVTVYQHPNGSPLQSALGASKSLWPAGVETRLHHDANTMGGTSGGLVLDQFYEPVALHQAGITLADRTILNSAIPIACIARPEIPFDTVDGVDPIWRLRRDGRPVFGRMPFQRFILSGKTHSSAIEDARVVIVRGEPKSGKSFSTAILREQLPPAEHVIVEVSAKVAPAGARDMAAMILDQAGLGPAIGNRLPALNEADTAVDAWVRDVLIKEFKSLLAQFAGQRKIWIVIDNLDDCPLPETDTLFFIERLLDGVADDDLLKFVLIGGARYAALCPQRYLATDDTGMIGVQEVAATIRLRSVALHDHDTSDSERLASLIVSAAQRGPGRYIDALINAYHDLPEGG
ncbi:serine protease [Massilia genomosp. 1]|uniref:ORC1/DEAH AAA+ ATPase domain-containing protein n=1 Tax=Massilia genomosp. 1 TaxID=2609280 RepID=A0ABX0MVL0_9BURK|nr:serine protease [Massilia genomosp. 1]NHZ64083.1 hypothetical protein [Massilia genomosp. 1]